MKKLLLLLLSIIPFLALAQSQDQNYVKTTTYKQPTTTAIGTPTIQQANVQVAYYDGLGRPIQQIAHKQAANGKDIVTHFEYDALGRQTKDFLPYTKTASLDFSSSANTDVVSFYNSRYQTNIAFSEKQLESSPLNRVFKQAAPGDNWAMNSGHEIEFDYQANEANDVKLFIATATWSSSLEIYDISLTQNNHYAENQLYKTITKDENHSGTTKNNTTEEFKNKQGQVVLKRTFNNNEAHDTYYVYDQFGNLTYVIPPLAASNPTAYLDDLCYQYKYDARNRLVEKKLPGKDWEFIVYDKLDRPVATGPVYSPFTDAVSGTVGWMITKYDTFGRVVYTGWYNGTAATSSGRNTLQTQLTNASTLSESKTTSTTIDNITLAYTNNAFPTSSLKLLTVNYYDDYNFPHANLVNTTMAGVTLATNVKGLPTGSWVRILAATSTTNAELSYTLYDYKYRPVRSFTQNYLGGYTQVDTSFDWAGKATGTVTTHKRTNSDTEITITETFEYTPQDRLFRHKHQVDSEAEVLLAENYYDDLGQLIQKNVGDDMQNVDYKYNIRGWLTSINEDETAPSENGYVQLGSGDIFAFKISYDDLLINNIYGVQSLYNGNISETQWVTSTDNVLRHYGYQYDHLNRLSNANFRKPVVGDEDDAFNESLSYDKNGNITDLNRNGKIYSDVQAIDILTYTYEGNQLMSVYDASTSPQGFNDGNTSGDDYEYDSFGNMTFDKNKSITSITYNHLNLPNKIEFANGNNIKYIYNAHGQKVTKIVRTGNEYADTDYLSGFQYRSSYTIAQGDQSEAVLQYFPHAEGYVQHLDGRYFYIYHYTDHLGNIRLSYTYDENAAMIKIMEENHYYPFGLKHDSYNTQHLGYTTYTDEDEIINYVLEEVPKFVGDGSYNYKYNGKELQDELGLNMYDYGARNYDPALGRWMNIDPLAEQMRRHSPYNYAFDNPVYFIDPDGMRPLDWVQTNGKMVYDSRVTDQASAIKHYGIYADWRESGYSYTANTGDKITLGDNANFTLNGEPMQSIDMAIENPTTDGLKVWGFGGDAVAGSGDMEGDRGSGSIQADGVGDVSMLFDFGQLLGDYLNSQPLFIAARAILSSNSSKSTESGSTESTMSSEPETVTMQRNTYTATDAFGGNDSRVHVGTGRDTVVKTKDKEIVSANNTKDSIKAAKEAKRKNAEYKRTHQY